MSTVPEVLAALATIARNTLPNSQTIEGTLGGVTTSTGRLVLIGDVDFEIIRQFDSLAGVTTTEQYVVPCSVVADVATPDQAVADAQAWADYETLETAIAAVPQLGLAGVFSLQAAIVGTQVFRRLADSDGRHAQVRFGVDVFAAND